ncbi:MAG: leader peptide processing enzyme [Treponema sp.]|nr:leader peptide processing enzyme [Treponema sp.]
MNKRANTILFILGATVFNVLTTIISMVILFLLYINFVMMLIPESGRSWGFVVIFLAALVISFVAYKFALNYFMKKIDVEKYFDPLYIKKFKKSEN